jgi:hypothetical protein
MEERKLTKPPVKHDLVAGFEKFVMSVPFADMVMMDADERVYVGGNVLVVVAGLLVSKVKRDRHISHVKR